MIIEKLVDKYFGENTYILGDENTKKCAVIDPGASVDDILKKVKSIGLTIEYILLTHCHGDHIANVKSLVEKTNAKIVAHKDEAELLKDRRKNLSYQMHCGPQEFDADIYVIDKEKMSLGDLKLTFIHTPGHTQGGMCIRVGQDMFTGDTLFAGTMGRTDLYSGDHKVMEKSLKRLATMENEIRIYPGHGPSSTLGIEKQSNPYM